MPIHSPYTTDALGVDDPRFVARTPGVADIERLFPSPSSSGRGRIAVEGGVCVVAGPGMGKSSLLANLAGRLDRDRSLATALVAFPPAAQYPDEGGFYAFLGDLVRRLRAGLAASPRMGEAALAPLAQLLASEPTWDAPGPTPGMSPRGFERWISALGAAAVHTPGVCLLFDDVDHLASAGWKNAFVAGLRFTFQTSAGITPVYALWSLFADESLPGSNYFRNVTRPVFLEPLAAQPSGPSERRAVVDLALSKLSQPAAAQLFRIAGGHPQLLHRVLADLCSAVDGPDALGRLAPGDIAPLLEPMADGQRAFVRALLALTPTLGVALRDIARGAHGNRPLARGLLATGLVDRDEAGQVVLPGRVAEAL